MQITLTLTSENAEMVGHNLSTKLNQNFYVVAYNDPKNGRVVLNIYPNTPESCNRIAEQIRTKKAAVFSRGQRVDKTMFEA